MQEEKIEKAKGIIREKLGRRKELIIKLKELNKIRKEGTLLEHLDLLSEVNNLKRSLGGFSTAKIVHHEFNISDSSDNKCPHDLWFYVGSFNSLYMSNGNFQNETRLSDEEQVGFLFNRYVCMDCGEYCDVRDWKDFEDKHKVLKSYDKPDFDFYLNLYHQLLYTTSSKEAINLLTEQFNLQDLGLERKRLY